MALLSFQGNEVVTLDVRAANLERELIRTSAVL